MDGMIEDMIREEYKPILLKIKELECVPKDIKEEIEVLLERTRQIYNRYGKEIDF
ncbi:hypothetical protein MARBORIA2_17760 [Methanobrevibacter arboriphilus]|jgi:hypothetical protein|uniref:Uncharacterized protein n=1 Tax=Methanobrevibacter arboriphilus TaxID=39441 RepID=A0ACA8R4R5_METAZ|nr:hypothetical protein [Methanobrevibacter arboriphilus]BBL62607.1 hypothetical protein MarbSA_16470 [Methanobrevibacter arboriphilus]GLI12686.1 hypothetical protein MARBORIA2_17760 [Methanobrevibacter arboriphilus]